MSIRRSGVLALLLSCPLAAFGSAGPVNLFGARTIGHDDARIRYTRAELEAQASAASVGLKPVRLRPPRPVGRQCGQGVRAAPFKLQSRRKPGPIFQVVRARIGRSRLSPGLR